MREEWGSAGIKPVGHQQNERESRLEKHKGKPQGRAMSLSQKLQIWGTTERRSGSMGKGCDSEGTYRHKHIGSRGVKCSNVYGVAEGKGRIPYQWLVKCNSGFLMCLDIIVKSAVTQYNHPPT